MLSSCGQEHICQLYTACTTEDTKDHILKSFTSPNGAIRIVVATIAFGLGLDVPNIRQTFHWGPSTDIEAHVQETGRSGWDSLPSIAVLFVSTSEQHKDVAVTPMQAYCVNKSICRWQVLMSELTAEYMERPIPLHNYCDIYMSECCCETCEHSKFRACWYLQDGDGHDCQQARNTTTCMGCNEMYAAPCRAVQVQRQTV